MEKTGTGCAIHDFSKSLIWQYIRNEIGGCTACSRFSNSLFDLELHMFQHRRKIESSFQRNVWSNPMPEPEIKFLVKRLGESINETLADSPKINERIQEIRDAGYEVFLVIEAKIGFSRTGKGEGDFDALASDEPVRLRITHEDAKFLKSLRIHTE